MTNPWIAALLALFVWWFSTGAILWAVRRADGQGPQAHLRLAILGLPLLVGGIALAALTRDAGGQAALFGGFLSALAVWGWIELAFLTGVVTGPARGPLPFCLSEAQRFRAAWRAVAWHEIMLAAGLIVLAALTLGAENTLAFWTYAILFLARISAKLNIFLGVPRINTEFLPNPLSHLPSYFRQGPVSWLFPLSILVLTLAVFCWIERLVFTGEMRFALLATLTGLALLEHWLMVLPLPDAKLWRWMLPAPTPKDDMPQSETPHGF
ncbi:putative photosynthetic complex assembly protein PuhE [Palleronia sp. LCG004]|uniref:putative photosynthetic complex assembly protein PuhE n=1 Tax=Palleronia sp. LCG004 TaxID=3079304 RepID=UPI0029431103|nr:putative photosynthetic complex assembly protein PuhE [Palleronia sp. LCG004]WOI56171.1 putative photosynthetic complex assembly protein PuhE [Palleronia sp. LCG004]